jgi:hypothetical protein
MEQLANDLFGAISISVILITVFIILINIVFKLLK